MKKYVILLIQLILVLSLSWSFTMFGLTFSGVISEIGSAGNGYWKLPNIQREEFGLSGSLDSLDYSFQVPDNEHDDWVLIETLQKNFGPSGTDCVVWYNAKDKAILMYTSSFNEVNIEAVRRFYANGSMFQGTYYEWYIINSDELFQSIINNMNQEKGKAIE